MNSTLAYFDKSTTSCPCNFAFGEYDVAQTLMTITGKKEPLFLFLGDAFSFFLALWITLFLRRLEEPSGSYILLHLSSFSFLFVVWFVVFFVAGLYENHTLLFRKKLPNTLFRVQATNILIAVFFFYFSPFEEIAPKTNLILYSVVSSLLIFFWRLFLVPLFEPVKKEKAIIIGSGKELSEIEAEVNHNSRYPLRFIPSIHTDSPREHAGEAVAKRILEEGVSVVVIDFDNPELTPALTSLYRLMFSHVRFFDMSRVYEELFDRVPLSLLREGWILQNISAFPRRGYSFLKRVMDIVIALPLFLFSILFYPFVFLAIVIEDGGKFFIFQERVGQRNKLIHLVKLRTMSFDDSKNPTTHNVITKVGKILRMTRIDELPQLWNVLLGEISLIGPRPELPNLVSEYERVIPYYSMRHTIKPGLSGWAQIRDADAPRRFSDIEKTKNKLSYDLYYIKNRSLMLDLKIALKTIKTLLSRSGA